MHFVVLDIWQVIPWGVPNMGYWKIVSAVALGVFIGGVLGLPAAIWLVDMMLRVS